MYKRFGERFTKRLEFYEKQGLVERRRGEKDRRTFTIQLKDKGKDKIESVLPSIVKYITGEMSKLTTAEQHKMQKMCKAIGLKKK